MTYACRGLALYTVAVSALFASGCRGVPEPVAEAPAAPPVQAAPAPTATLVALAMPSLELVQGEGVVSSAGKPQPELPSTLGVGNAIDVADGGLVVLRWEPGLRAELLAGSRALLEAATRDRTARLVQTAGIARYTLAPAAAGSALDVSAGAVDLLADELADVIVGFDPDAAGATWVFVVDGAVALGGTTSVATGADDTAVPASAARLTAGHAVVFMRGGRQPVALPIDLPAVEAWYASALAGTAPAIARASFRCAVRADAQSVRLRALPPASEDALDASAGGDSALDHASAALEGARAAMAGQDPSPAYELLAPRTLVEVAARDEAGAWLQVTVVPEGGIRPRTLGAVVGWLSVDDLDCVGPIEGLAAVDASAPTVAEAPAPEPLARATATPGPASFAADRTAIAAGDCVMLTWDIPVGTAVTLNGRAVAGKGVERTCPETVSSYRLAWVDADGNRVERLIHVAIDAVGSAQAGQRDERSGAGAAAPAEPTPCSTECVIAFPTLPPEPTRRPRPTPTVRPEPSSPPPAPTAEPTSASQPQPTSAPPNPTRPPNTPEPDPGVPTQPPDPSATPDPTEPAPPTQAPDPGTPETPEPGTPAPPPDPEPTQPAVPTPGL